MKTFTIFSSLLFALVINSCDTNSQNLDKTNETQLNQRVNSIQKTYKLEKFTKSCCSGIVEYALKEVKGYIKSEANVTKQELTVWYNPTKCSEKDIIAAINLTSYKVIENN